MRPDARLFPDALWSGGGTSDGVVHGPLIAAECQRADAVAFALDELKRMAAALDESVDALRALLAEHEPVEFVSAIAIPSSIGLSRSKSPVDDGAETFTWAAKIEYLLGLALSVPPGQGSTPSEITDRAIGLLGDVFDAASAREMLASLSQASPDVNLDQTLMMLRTEHLLDRMDGYVKHLELIDGEVFDRHRSYYADRIGFNPADVTRVVRRYTRARQQRSNTYLRQAHRFPRSHDDRSAQAVVDWIQEVTALHTWRSDTVAEVTGVDAREIDGLLSFFSTRFGSQPEFRYPTDENIARTMPCVDLGDSTYFVPDLWALPSAVHPRLAKLAKEDRAGRLDRYHRHRQEGHERATAGVFRRVFGNDLVSERCHYIGSQGPGEVDVLVRTEWPLIGEDKAHGLTEPGRRGAPDRVKRVAVDVIKQGLEQTRRARSYVQDEGGRAFSATDGGPPTIFLGADPVGMTEVIVTFERMDPLVVGGPGLVGEAGREVWIVCLADLLMVSEVLSDAAAFHHYARTRAAMSLGGPVVFMESDALGRYLDDRLAGPIARAAEKRRGTLLLGYSSGSINEFYTALEIGQAADPPDTGVPSQVANSLTRTAGTNTTAWTTIVDEVMAATPKRWRKWRTFARHHRQGGVFLLSDKVGLVTGAKDARIELGSPLLLHVETGATVSRSRV